MHTVMVYPFPVYNTFVVLPRLLLLFLGDKVLALVAVVLIFHRVVAQHTSAKPTIINNEMSICLHILFLPFFLVANYHSPILIQFVLSESYPGYPI